MRCDDIREQLDTLWGAELPSEATAHLAVCSSCSAHHRDALLLREGLDLWKRDQSPEPSVGFAQRVIRQLGGEVKSPRIADFLELVGRRFVFGTLALVLFALLALTVPSSGPVHSLTVADVQVRAQEASLSSPDPMDEVNLLESPETAPANAARPAVMNEAK